MKIICVGRNYAEHAAEMNSPTPSEPVIFLKPDTALLRNNADFYLPEFSQEVHYECEVVFRISRLGKHIAPEFALSYLDGVGLGIDFTARDLQNQFKKQGLPWDLAKGFNGSAPVSEMQPVAAFEDLNKLDFELFINEKSRQKDSTKNMIFSITTLLAFVSQYYVLKSGDLIFTGTPAGVGPVHAGDHLVGYLQGKPLLDFKVK